jgi:hypothetical protein
MPGSPLRGTAFGREAAIGSGENAAGSMSGNGTLRTFRDVRFPVAIRCKADLEQTAFTCEFASPSPAVAFPRALAFAHLRLTQEFCNIPRESARQPTEPSRTRC